MKVAVIKERMALPDKSRHADVLDECETRVDEALEQIQQEFGADAVVTRGQMMREVVEPFDGDAYVEVTCSIQVMDFVVIASTGR